MNKIKEKFGNIIKSPKVKIAKYKFGKKMMSLQKQNNLR
jgi:hypothetical protein